MEWEVTEAVTVTTDVKREMTETRLEATEASEKSANVKEEVTETVYVRTDVKGETTEAMLETAETNQEATEAALELKV